MSIATTTAQLRPYVLTLLRLTTAYMFLLHGWMKFSGGVAWGSLPGVAMCVDFHANLAHHFHRDLTHPCS